MTAVAWREEAIAYRAENLSPFRLIRLNQTIARLARRYDTILANAWMRPLVTFQRHVELRRLEAALAGGHFGEIESALDVTRLEQSLQRAMQNPIRAAVVQGGQATQKAMAKAGLVGSFNAVHPNVVLYAHEHAAQLVTNVTVETQATIRAVVGLGAQGLLTVYEQSRLIRSMVGLPSNWLGAPIRLADELRARDLTAASRRFSATEAAEIRSRIAAGTSGDPAFVGRMTEVYSQRLLNLRAMNIARTESIAASNWGVNELWAQLQAKKILGKKARRFWLSTPDGRLCPICARIPSLNPQGVRIGQPFATPLGPRMMPPAHPSCRCSMGILPTPASTVTP